MLASGMPEPWGQAGGAYAPPDFDGSVNPISIRGQIMHPSLQLLIHSDIPGLVVPMKEHRSPKQRDGN